MIRLLRFGVKVKTADCRDNLLIGHCQTCAGCPRTSFFVFQQDSAPSASRTQCCHFPERQKEARDASGVRAHGAHFKQEF